MRDQELVRLVLQEAAPREDEILEVLQTGDESWAVRFAEVDIELELEPETRRLMLSAEIARVPGERGAAIHKILLTYSLLWRETGGMRMALSEPDGIIVQLVDIHCTDLTTDLLVIVLCNLNERTLLWREFLAGGTEGGGVVPHPEFPMIHV